MQHGRQGVLMMKAVKKREGAVGRGGTVCSSRTEVGDELLWEGLLRHDMPRNADEERISVSFNYKWA